MDVVIYAIKACFYYPSLYHNLENQDKSKQCKAATLPKLALDATLALLMYAMLHATQRSPRLCSVH